MKPGAGTGLQFGKFTVIDDQGDFTRAGKWSCRCDCGTERLVHWRNLLRGLSKSCGCLAIERRNFTTAAKSLANKARKAKIPFLTCSVCKQAKPKIEFHKNKTKRDGHTTACRWCVRVRRAGNHTGNQQRSDSDPIKRSARSKLSYAVKRGHISKSQNCSACLKHYSDPRKIEEHHYLGYEHPLSVQWFCRQCHALADWKINSPISVEVSSGLAK